VEIEDRLRRVIKETLAKQYWSNELLTNVCTNLLVPAIMNELDEELEYAWRYKDMMDS